MAEVSEASVRGCPPTRPSRGDLLVSAAALVLSLLPFLVGTGSAMLVLDPAWVLVPLGALGSLALIGRHLRPWTVWAAVTAVGVVAVAVAGGPTTAYVPAVVALFTICLVVTTVRATLAALVTASLPVAVILLFGSGGVLDAVASGMTAWSGIALMSAIAVRNQRAVVAAAHERARLAEASREEEAQRRVTQERFRIARELHDVIAHHVSVINVQAGVASHLMRQDPDTASAAMGHVREASQSVLREVSDMLGLLRTEGEADEPVTAPVPRLEEYDGLVEHTRRAGVQVVWQTRGAAYELSPGVDLTAYRVVQEALTNAARHGAGEVRVQLDYLEEALSLEITNPCADAPVTPTQGRHGLAGMRERVAAVGGTLVAGPDGSSHASGSWVVRVRLPTGAATAAAPAVAEPLPL